MLKKEVVFIMKFRLSLAVKDRVLQKRLRDYFSNTDIVVRTFGHLKAPWERILRSSSDIIIISNTFIPASIGAGVSFMSGLPEAPGVVIIHTSESTENYAHLIASGADTVIYENMPFHSMILAIESVIESRRLVKEQDYLINKGSFKPKLEDFDSKNEKMCLFMEEVKQVLSGSTPLLVLGETGVGKEHLAKAIHNAGLNSNGPFVPIHIAGLPEQLLESELFGHEQGAFTNAGRYRKGAFELAHNGTIFLDEIGEIPLHLQVKLLRVLQDYEFKPIGAEKSIKVNVRVIAATNRDLAADVENGIFRRDLFYRLNVIPLTVPPLRDRKEDILPLSDVFLKHYSGVNNKNIKSFSKEAKAALIYYDWPGNIRELMNIIERAVILCKKDVIEVNLLPGSYNKQAALHNDIQKKSVFDSSLWGNKTLHEVCREMIEKIEEQYINMVLRKTRGRVGKAADIAGIHSRGLYNKMKAYNIKKEDFKREK